MIPIFNEEGNIERIVSTLTPLLEVYASYEIIFVNDGSRDGTLGLVKRCREANANVHYISFSRNFGHQGALRAGLDYATGDCVISMDGDLQHPPELIPVMIERWLDGYDVVYTKRRELAGLSFFKLFTSKAFYSLINGISDTRVEPGAADFRLMDKVVLEVIKGLRENNLFMRGMIAWVGFEQIAIEYTPNERQWGKSQYTFKKMLNLALAGITGFSVKPLHLSTIAGVVIAALSFCYALYAIYLKLFTDVPVAGWASVLVSVLFMGGVQLIMIGILGEYIGKLFMESKRRPDYIIREKSL